MFIRKCSIQLIQDVSGITPPSVRMFQQLFAYLHDKISLASLSLSILLVQTLDLVTENSNIKKTVRCGNSLSDYFYIFILGKYVLQGSIYFPCYPVSQDNTVANINHSFLDQVFI